MSKLHPSEQPQLHIMMRTAYAMLRDMCQPRLSAWPEKQSIDGADLQTEAALVIWTCYWQIAALPGVSASCILCGVSKWTVSPIMDEAFAAAGDLHTQSQAKGKAGLAHQFCYSPALKCSFEKEGNCNMHMSECTAASRIDSLGPVSAGGSGVRDEN